jgi:hypothetical protein
MWPRLLSAADILLLSRAIQEQNLCDSNIRGKEFVALLSPFQLVSSIRFTSIRSTPVLTIFSIIRCRRWHSSQEYILGQTSKFIWYFVFGYLYLRSKRSENHLSTSYESYTTGRRVIIHESKVVVLAATYRPAFCLQTRCLFDTWCIPSSSFNAWCVILITRSVTMIP